MLDLPCFKLRFTYINQTMLCVQCKSAKCRCYLHIRNESLLLNCTTELVWFSYLASLDISSQHVCQSSDTRKWSMYLHNFLDFRKRHRKKQPQIRNRQEKEMTCSTNWLILTLFCHDVCWSNIAFWNKEKKKKKS